MKWVLLFVSMTALLSIDAYAQREFNNWYFGNRAAITFNGMQPKAIAGSKLSATEGCSSVSDRYGNLLFYTDGRTVYNKYNDVMDNGDSLAAGESSSQGALIVPRPGNNLEYYIFTTDDHAQPKGLRYSTVDMTADGGIGKVIKKNILLCTPTTEKITAVRHMNEEDIWVITHRFESNAFVAYLLTNDGITDSVISNVGMVHRRKPEEIGTGVITENTMGCLTSSLHGTRLALGYYNLYEVFKFDPLTGKVSSPIVLRPPKDINQAYGVAFSPDGTKLYCSSIFHNGLLSYIFQYDLSAGDATAINNSVVILRARADQRSYGAIQMGPDKKLYISKTFGNFIDKIDKPDEQGIASDYIDDAVDLEGPQAELGLPGFIQTTKNKINLDVNSPTCMNYPVYFKCTSIDAVKFEWTGPNGFTSTEQNPVIDKSTPEMTGTYKVVLTYKDGFMDSASIDLKINETKFVQSGDGLFDPLAIGGMDTKVIKYRNNSDFEIYLDTIYNKGTAGNVFQLGDVPSFPYPMPPGSELQIKVNYYPVEVVNYRDSLVVEIQDPCNYYHSTELFGRGLTKDLHVWLPDTVGEVGQEDFCIPLKAVLLCQDTLFYKSKYTVEIAFDYRAFLPYDGQPGITDRFENEEQILTIKGGPVTFNPEPLLLANICGTVYWGKEDTTILKIRSFTWDDTLTTIYKHDGSLTVKDFCAFNIRRVKYLYRTNMMVSPNPASEDLSVNVDTKEGGKFELSIYNITGSLIYKDSWITSEGEVNKNKNLSIGLNNFSDGTYTVVLKTPNEALRRPLVIIK